MKKTGSVLLVVVLLAIGCKPKLATDTPENTMRSVLSVIQYNDVEGLKSMLLTPAEIESWMKENDQENIEAVMGDVEDMYSQLPNILKLVRNVAEKKGMDWSSCEIIGVENMTKEGDSHVAMAIHFESGGAQHTVRANVTQKAEGWKLVAPPEASWLEMD